MILYISDEDHEEELNYLNEDIHTRIFQNQDMTHIFRKELQHMGAVTHVIVESQAVDSKTWDTAAESFRLSRNIPLLLLVDNPDLPDTFVREDNYDTLNRSHNDISEKLCNWIRNSIQEGSDTTALNHVWIAVAGLTPGAGTTALALHLASYIRRQDQEVSVTERADAFTYLAEAYEWRELAEGSYQWGGIIYNHNQIDGDMPYTIFDLGVMKPKCHALWKQCQIKILVADGKPYHLHGLNEQLRQLEGYPGKIILAFTFVPEAEKGTLRKEYSSEHVIVWFAPLEPDLFLTSDEYQEIVEGYVTPVPEEKKQKKVIPFRLPKVQISKNKMILGSILILSLMLAFGVGAAVTHRKETGSIQMAVESVPRMDFTGITRIRMILAREQAETIPDTEYISAEDTVTEDTAEAPEGVSTEAAREKNTQKETGQGERQNTMAETEAGTEAPVTEASTQEAQEQIPAPVTPSLSGYNGQIYTGSDVIRIMNQLSGQPVAMHLITRSSDNWYNYSISNGGFIAAGSVSSGTSLIDVQCSFLCQVIQINGEDAGLMFVQQ